MAALPVFDDKVNYDVQNTFSTLPLRLWPAGADRNGEEGSGLL